LFLIRQIETTGEYTMRSIPFRTLFGLVIVCLLHGAARAATLPAPVVDSDYYNDGQPGDAKVILGQALFFDKILSGNKNIACSTCHHPQHFGGDGLSLAIGEGGEGLGPERNTGSGSNAIRERIGRNSPPLFNLGAKEFVRLNWQGRHQVVSTGLSLPCRTATVNACPTGLENIIAGQNLFPLVNIPEMPGHPAENEVVDAPPQGTKGVSRFPYMWEAIMARIRMIPEYVQMFQDAFPDVNSAADMKIVHLTNALAAFQIVAFRSDESPFDLFLRGDKSALTASQKRGMNLFYGDANCASCHSGSFQTDQLFHAIAMPQIGPGVFVNNKSQKQEDVGRFEVTTATDSYKFRTPTLRNVALTAPYGHAGAFATLEGMVSHHLNPVDSFNTWDRSQVILPSRTDLDVTDFFIMDDFESAQRIVDANELGSVTLSAAQFKDLIAFLNALTDPAVHDLINYIPASVPSGLPVVD
jgi:cytochrome c peroxidase